MTFEDLLQEFFLEKVEENPDIDLNSLIRDKSSDSVWIEEQQQLDTKDAIKDYFKKIKEADFEVIETEKR